MYKISDALQSFGPQQLHQGHGAFLLRCLASTKTGGKSARKKHNAQSINSMFTSMCVCWFWRYWQTNIKHWSGWYGLFSCIPPNVWNIQQQLHSGTPFEGLKCLIAKEPFQRPITGATKSTWWVNGWIPTVDGSEIPRPTTVWMVLKP